MRQHREMSMHTPSDASALVYTHAADFEDGSIEVLLPGFRPELSSFFNKGILINLKIKVLV